MKKFVVAVALLAVAACAKKEEAVPAADTTASAPAADSTRARDTATAQ